VRLSLVAVVLALGLGGCATEVVEAGPEVAEPSGVVQVTVAAPDTTPEPEPEPPSPVFAIGDCLTWDQDAESAVFEGIDCAEPHLAEVAGVLDLSAVYPADAALPSVEELVAEGAAACPDIVVAYLGAEPADDVEGGVVAPSEADWADGVRTWFCTVGFARVDGFRPAYTGRLAQGDATRP
jgi:hypothetical protein